MGLDFSKTGTTTASAAASTVENEIEAVMPYDIAADRAQMNAELVDSAEVDAIVSTIEVYNLETIASSARKRPMRSQRHQISYSTV